MARGWKDAEGRPWKPSAAQTERYKTREKEWLKELSTIPCEECGRLGVKSRKTRLCDPHYRRRLGSVKRHSIRAAKGSGSITNEGYRVVTISPGLKRKEHLIVMEELLGRKLHSFERIHHRNGIRSDNRPENLELWAIRQHPAGARVSDLVKWVVSQYRGEVEALLKEQL